MSERSVLSLAELAAGRPLVERPAPGKAPTAFRIWAYGPNECDGKPVVFSERSAEALLAEQAARGRLYSFDFDHRSTMSDVSPDAGKSAGWHVLDVREYGGKPELWASTCDWTSEARDGLEAIPAEWRYFSPCYDVDPATREVTSYVNCALTNNPLTHGIPALASKAGAVVAAPPSRAGGTEPREGVCEECDRAYPVWVAPNSLWNRVVRDGGDGEPFLCPTCFALLAEARGVKPAAWVMLPETPEMLATVLAPCTASDIASPPARPGRLAHALARTRLAILRSRS